MMKMRIIRAIDLYCEKRSRQLISSRGNQSTVIIPNAYKQKQVAKENNHAIIHACTLDLGKWERVKFESHTKQCHSMRGKKEAISKLKYEMNKKRTKQLIHMATRHETNKNSMIGKKPTVLAKCSKFQGKKTKK